MMRLKGSGEGGSCGASQVRYVSKIGENGDFRSRKHSQAKILK